MTNYLFMLSCSRDAERVRRCLRLAKLAVLKGRVVHLFLIDDAVTLAKHMSPRVFETLPEPPRDEIDKLIEFLRKSRITIHLEKRSVRDKLAPQAPLPEGARLSDEARLIDMAENAKVFSF